MYRFEAELWRWESVEAAWFFVTVPDDVSDDIEATAPGVDVGFGSVRVEATVGATTWRTSVFPDSKRKAYVLPLKKDVRKRESIDEGDVVEVALNVIES